MRTAEPNVFSHGMEDTRETLAAWRGARTLALALFAVTLIASVATYLHHATDVLKLSF